MINLFGLIFGMISVLIIAKYIGGSLHFDDFHKEKERIYNITQEESLNGSPFKKSDGTYIGIGEIIKNQYPEVSMLTRYNYHVESLVSTETDNKVSFNENQIFSVDNNFLKIFTFPLIHGNPESALSGNHSAVLTQSTSFKYFGDVDPVGETITIKTSWGEEHTYDITGVVEDIPKRSNFKFNILINQSQFNASQYWDVPECRTYVLLKKNIDAMEFENKLNNHLKSSEPLKLANKQVVLSIRSISNVQLTKTEYLLVIVGIFVLIISWVNFINQNITQSYGRFKEIGVLRVTGSSRSDQIIQFIFEASLICMSSFILIFIIYLLIEPQLQLFTDYHLLPLINDPTKINLIFLSIFIFGTILSAFIPALILNTQNLTTSLKAGHEFKIGSVGLRKQLVILQFTLSTILVIGIVVITKQLTYMNNKDKGIAMGNTIIIKSPKATTTWGKKAEKIKLFKEKCAKLPYVAGVSASSTVPGEEYRQETYVSLKGNEEKTMVYGNAVDDQFMDLYGIKFIAGNNFIPDAPWRNKRTIIINELAAKKLGISDYENALKSKLVIDGNIELELVGIVSNYHKTSLKHEMKPMIFYYNTYRGNYSLKINHIDNVKQPLDAIKEVWAEVYPGDPFDYFFLDEKYKAQDREDIYFEKLFKFFTVLSIVISCLGLLGFSLLISIKRDKEIGIRKTFGATTSNILLFFTRDYARSLIIAIIIGVPTACFLMNMWLSNFAYHTQIGFWSVSLSVVGLFILFLFTVSFHTIKSSLTNPVNTLREGA